VHWIGPRTATTVRAFLAAALTLTAVNCGSTTGQAPQTGAPAPNATTAPAQQTTTTIPGARPSPGCQETATTGTTAPAGPVERTLTVDGVERTYLVSTKGTTRNVPAPVITLLHGMGSTAADINRVTDLPDQASAAGTIVVTPQAVGTPTLWRPAAQGPDAAFLDQILVDLGQTACIDTARVHVAGFSVGAALAAAYACARQDEIASIVTVTVEAPGGCVDPMPILSFHGTADPVIAYGNSDPNASGGVTGTEANMATWARTAGCQFTPTTTNIGSEVVRLEWPGCRDAAEVVLYRIVGGGHDWPGKDPATAVVPSTQQVSATKEALSFYGRHHQ